MGESKKRVGVLGLGRMGAALAGALLGAGHDVSVWNRSPLKAGPLLDRGARLAATPAEAASADVVLSCLSTYDTQQPVLEAAALTGRTLVNLTSGTPEQARAAAKWAASEGIGYVDGVIMAVPQGIGTPAAQLLYGGAEPAFAAQRDVLEVLGTPVFLGEDAGLAALYDLALLGMMWSTMAGYLQALALVGTEGVTPAQFAPMATAWQSAVGGFLPGIGEQVASGDYATDVSALDINAAGLALLVETSRAQGIDTAVPAVLQELFDRAVAAGHGAHAIASVIEEIR
ncbi:MULTISPECIES: NAD(P)-binding domain-containing protein [unclassified Amycolatopsis]|uniref:NAD(P)-dependent oxidoreductase n=1 Tax=unclassified Amycolatopsis TaxID=2618356 RepID=UPI002874B722|nr:MULTISPECIES: NAD(P)-binding domain-containing protein [unclassified Amycolatopsis]MDS0135180.1 NAD(P)-dependent oxidoreductase [Amycolatopsis sp. 505]MDS0143043.1 NAD(P)-dependent oxidoreductase [Amycolatopsis sp. CM201R]